MLKKIYIFCYITLDAIDGRFVLFVFVCSILYIFRELFSQMVLQNTSSLLGEMFRLLRWDQKIPTCSAGFMKGWQRSPATLRDFLALFVKRLSGEHDAMCPMCQRGHLYQLQLATPHPPHPPPHPSRSATAWKQVTFGSGCDLRIRTVARSNVPSSNKLTNGWWDGYLPRSIQTGTRTDARVPLHTRRCHVSGHQMDVKSWRKTFFFPPSAPFLLSWQVRQDQAEAFWRSLKPMAQHRGHMLPAWQIRRIKSPAHPSRPRLQERLQNIPSGDPGALWSSRLAARLMMLIVREGDKPMAADFTLFCLLTER